MLSYFAGTEIFHYVKPHAVQQVVQLDRLEEAEPRLTSRGRSFCSCNNASAALSRIILKRFGIIENDGSLW
ncbi:hypothetical protein SAMN05216525_14716 [Bradyrhizobium sp. Gha]|nr:hypothetical protein SAMN05216525_14716 [Bradyrhizobium sp. Gha]